MCAYHALILSKISLLITSYACVASTTTAEKLQRRSPSCYVFYVRSTLMLPDQHLLFHQSLFALSIAAQIEKVQTLGFRDEKLEKKLAALQEKPKSVKASLGSEKVAIDGKVKHMMRSEADRAPVGIL